MIQESIDSKLISARGNCRWWKKFFTSIEAGIPQCKNITLVKVQKFQQNVFKVLKVLKMQRIHSVQLLYINIYNFSINATIMLLVEILM